MPFIFVRLFCFFEWFRGHRAALCQTVFLHLCVSLRPSLFFFLHWYCSCALRLFFSYRDVLLPYAVWAYASQLSAFAVLFSYFLRPALSVVVIPGLTDFSLLIKSASLRGETYTHLFRPYFRPIRFIDSAGDDR